MLRFIGSCLQRKQLGRRLFLETLFLLIFLPEINDLSNGDNDTKNGANNRDNCAKCRRIHIVQEEIAVRILAPVIIRICQPLDILLNPALNNKLLITPSPTTQAS
jgi:hypothetical protein